MHVLPPVRPKVTASLTFRGFAASPQEVQALIGRPASIMVASGEARKPGTPPFHRSAAGWKIEFLGSASLDEIVVALLESVGGVENIAAARAAVLPEFLEVDIAMWIINSEEQEGGCIEPRTIEMLGQIGAILSFGFYARSDA